MKWKLWSQELIHSTNVLNNYVSGIFLIVEDDEIIRQSSRTPRDHKFMKQTCRAIRAKSGKYWLTCSVAGKSKGNGYIWRYEKGVMERVTCEWRLRG